MPCAPLPFKTATSEEQIPEQLGNLHPDQDLITPHVSVILNLKFIFKCGSPWQDQMEI